METTSTARHGAISRQDAIAAFGFQEVRRRHESGRWRAPWEGVLIDGTRASDPLTLAAAAVLLGGPDAVLAGPTAAHMHGCRSVEPLPVHLIVPYGHWLRSRAGLIVHNGGMLDADREERQGLPVLCFERVLTDMLCRSGPSDALAVMDEALAMVEPSRREHYRAAIARRIEHRSDPRGTRRGVQLLDLATGEAASPAESWFLWRIVDAGFPVPQVNWSLFGPDGLEIYRLDYAWPELRIVVEYDGHAYHAGREAEDQARAEDLRRRGWIVIRAGAEDLGRPEQFEARLEQAFGQRGVDVGRRAKRALRGRRHREPGERRRAR
ncbi:DUF559 domain-containing protein [Pseudonocardia aurantiaca]|uniref:DUF559 domain-containing protein n=1 Tax=Pseudonocardia aurantiaca TaxID=75290 RepID=A0ABW4FD23_9PSEU